MNSVQYTHNEFRQVKKKKKKKKGKKRRKGEGGTPFSRPTCKCTSRHARRTFYIVLSFI